MTARSKIFGYDFICEGTYDDLTSQVMDDVNSGAAGITNFITPNAHGINVYAKYPELNKFCQTSRYVLPDGQPLVWLSSFTPQKIKQRLTGSDFFPVIFNQLKTTNAHCMFVLSNDLVKEKLKEEMPSAEYLIPPFFSMAETDKIADFARHMAEIIVKSRINYVFIGISEPKQGALAMAATDELKRHGYKSSCVFFFLGASYEFYAGLKKRAPLFFQRTGFEWLYRLLSEPQRMYKRYIFGNLSFVFRSLKWILNGRG